MCQTKLPFLKPAFLQDQNTIFQQMIISTQFPKILQVIVGSIKCNLFVLFTAKMCNSVLHRDMHLSLVHMYFDKIRMHYSEYKCILIQYTCTKTSAYALFSKTLILTTIVVHFGCVWHYALLAEFHAHPPKCWHDGFGAVAYKMRERCTEVTCGLF